MTVLEAIENFIKGKWKYEIKQKENVTAFLVKNMSLGSLDDDILITVTYSADELMGIFFTFDQPEKTADVCYFLENINEESNLLTACINSDGYFELRARAITITDSEDAGAFLDFAFDELKSLEKSLAYITELTH